MRTPTELPHVRDVELSGLLDQNMELSDVIHLCAHKVSLVHGNKHATLTVIQDMMWSALSTLWDQNLLVRKHDLLKLLRVHDESSEEASSLKLELAVKEKQLKSALEVIKKVQAQSYNQRSEHTLDSENPCAWSIDAVVEPTVSVIEKGVGFERDEDGVPVRYKIVTQEGFRVETVESEPVPQQLDEDAGESHLQNVMFPVSMYEAENVKQLMRARSMMTDAPTPERVQTGSFSTEGSNGPGEETDKGLWRPQAESAGLFNEAIEDVRINQLLFEIAEKDEIIDTLSGELGIGSSRRSSTSQLLACSPSEVPAILSTRLSELEALRTRNGELAQLIEQLRVENVDLEARLNTQSRREPELFVARLRSLALHDRDILDDTGRISECNPSSFNADLTDAPCQTDLWTTALSSSVYPSIAIPPVISEVDLFSQLDAEKRRSEKALEETRRVKVCLDELERQLVSMQFQLRKAGVHQEHIQHAMRQSGLGNLMRVSHAAVFERLYRDAIERMQRLEKIRAQVHQIQARRLMKRAIESGGGLLSSTKHPPIIPEIHALPKTAPTTGILKHSFGGGFMAGALLSRTQAAPMNHPALKVQTCVTGIRLG